MTGYCLISDRYDISVLADKHPEDKTYQNKVQDLSKRYTGIRKVEGDGNCFYRALGFAYLESITGHKQEIKKFKDIALHSKDELLSAGFEETSFCSTFSNFLKAVSLVETENCTASLLNLFNDRCQSDSIVQYLRLLTSAYLKNQTEFFQYFLENGTSINTFCAQEVEPMNKECDHIQITALSEALRIPVQVEYMDTSDNVINHHTFPEGATPLVYLLYKSSHYEILYVSDKGG
ncbi:ubiquitin thioesterase OTUB2 isoform X2 [Protopterus annectens]|uniref:ubiquitin thioesterase OTUB2 isoform X2 n=1 Tax=Protopterus annectens TaxID=7888 RepID=UPI001CFB1271|nr:ubiquitin thioesterase OTUB2 isoform X2 [Protopterus annectens]